MDVVIASVDIRATFTVRTDIECGFWLGCIADSNASWQPARAHSCGNLPFCFAAKLPSQTQTEDKWHAKWHGNVARYGT